MDLLSATLVSPVRYVSRQTDAHFRRLWLGFDPFLTVDEHLFTEVCQSEGSAWRRLNGRFRLPVLVQVVSVYNLLFERAYYGTWSPPAEAHEFTRIMTRFWPGTLQQRDVIFSGPYLIGCSYFFNLAREHWPQARWFMYTTRERPEVVISNGQREYSIGHSTEQFSNAFLSSPSLSQDCRGGWWPVCTPSAPG